MAEKASTEIFDVFGWRLVGPRNKNWACVERERHDRKRTGTHPSDAVFRYQDPWTGNETYVTSDLKSYAKGTIQPQPVVMALRNLSRSVECAGLSEEFRRLYLDEAKTYKVHGMLFVYNHDGGYDEDFNATLEDINPSQADVAENNRVGVIGPRRVIYLNSIAKDLLLAQTKKGEMGTDAEWGFHYPNLQKIRFAKTISGVANLETLLSPWLVVHYNKFTLGIPKSGFLVYYDGNGNSVHEFQHLLDYLFKYQLATDEMKISIRMAMPCADAAALFQKAKDNYSEDYWPVARVSPEQVRKRMENITMSAVTSLVQRFSEVEIGMV
ncbi:MAG TPA: hypothetical protein VKV04_07275 [Verrucomicrobiae bacterium]|nr:hypothetical protein [Verrucomicrobiae bacterium]